MLLDFSKAQLKELIDAASFSDTSAVLIDTKKFILRLKKRCEVNMEIHRLLYNNNEMEKEAAHS